MDSVYLVCAIAGGAILVIQFVLSLFGGDTDTDLDADMGTDFEAHPADVGDDFLRLLSVKTLVSGATFFGLSGLAARQFELTQTWSLGIAIVAGLAAIYIVAQLMQTLASLQSSGNIDLKNAIGSDATCYLRIPANHSGAGAIHVTLQGRVVECKAVTRGAEIPTGANVRVVAVHNPNTLEVAAAG